MFQLFSKILPIKGSKTQEKAIQKSFGMSLEDFIFVILHDLAEGAIKKENQEKSEGILDWICEAILYMKNERDDYPEMNIDYTEQKKPQSSL